MIPYEEKNLNFLAGCKNVSKATFPFKNGFSVPELEHFLHRPALIPGTHCSPPSPAGITSEPDVRP